MKLSDLQGGGAGGGKTLKLSQLTASPPPPPPPPPAPPPEKPGLVGQVVGAVGDQLGGLWHDVSGRTHQAVNQTFRDVGGAFDPNKTPAEMQAALHDQSVIPRLAGDVGGALWAIPQGVIDYAVGRPGSSAINKVTGAHVTPQQVGDVASLALPIGGELAGEAQVSKIAREMGVSREAASEILARSAARQAATKAAAARAKPGPIRRTGAAFAEIGDRVRAGVGQAREPGALTPHQRATGERVGSAYLRRVMGRLDPAGEKLGANRIEASGKPITAAEALGRGAEVQLKTVGRRMGQTPENLDAQLTARKMEAPDRIMGDFADVTGLTPEDIHGDFTTHTAKLRAKAAPLYEEANAVGALQSPKLDALAVRPSLKKALPRAFMIAEEEGRNPAEIGLVRKQVPLVKDGKILMRGDKPIMSDGEEVEVKNPTTQTWDYAKRALDDVIEDYRDKTTGKLNLDEQGRAIVNTAKELRGELFSLNPKYEKAVAAGGEPLRQEEAYKSAADLMSTKVTGDQFDQRIKSFTPAQMEALKAGWVKRTLDTARSGQMSRSLNQMLTPLYREKLTKLFGKEQADALMQRLEDEKLLATRGDRMRPSIGSDTSETVLGAADQEAELRHAARTLKHVAGGQIVEAVLSMISAPVVGAYRGGSVAVDEATRDYIGKLLAGPPSALKAALEKEGLSANDAAEVQKLIRRKSVLDQVLKTAPVVGGASSIIRDQQPAP